MYVDKTTNSIVDLPVLCMLNIPMDQFLWWKSKILDGWWSYIIFRRDEWNDDDGAFVAQRVVWRSLSIVIVWYPVKFDFARHDRNRVTKGREKPWANPIWTRAQQLFPSTQFSSVCWLWKVSFVSHLYLVKITIKAFIGYPPPFLVSQYLVLISIRSDASLVCAGCRQLCG